MSHALPPRHPLRLRQTLGIGAHMHTPLGTSHPHCPLVPRGPAGLRRGGGCRIATSAAIPDARIGRSPTTVHTIEDAGLHIREIHGLGQRFCTPRVSGGGSVLSYPLIFYSWGRFLIIRTHALLARQDQQSSATIRWDMGYRGSHKRIELPDQITAHFRHVIIMEIHHLPIILAEDIQKIFHVRPPPQISVGEHEDAEQEAGIDTGFRVCDKDVERGEEMGRAGQASRRPREILRLPTAHWAGGMTGVDHPAARAPEAQMMPALEAHPARRPDSLVAHGALHQCSWGVRSGDQTIKKILDPIFFFVESHHPMDERTTRHLPFFGQ